MALNKLDLINKVWRMRDVTAANNDVDVRSHPAVAAYNRNGPIEGVNNNEPRVMVTTGNHQTHQIKQRQDNNNFTRNEQEVKRINLIEKTDDGMLRSVGQSQRNITSTYAKALCSHHKQQTQHETQFKREAESKPNETSLKESCNMSHGQQHHHTGVDCSKTRFTTAAKQQQVASQMAEPVASQQYPQNHLNHAPTCQASKLLVNSGAESAPNQTRLINNKHHQPHCIYHNKQKQHQQHLIGRMSDEPNTPNVVVKGDSRCKRQQQPSKYHRSQQDKYLLVEYLPTKQTESHAANNNRSHLPGSRLATAATNGYSHSSSKRATIKFISQLYFLLHLSAILSLLLHHKNLVISKSKSPEGAQYIYSSSHPSSSSGGHLVNQSILVNDTISQQTTIAPIVNPLPVPLMLMSHDHPKSYRSGQHRNQHHIISSVVVAPTFDEFRSPPPPSDSNRRFGRQVAAVASISNLNYQQQLLLQANQDILVRLMGPAHARYALRYFLSYLLMTSVVVLVCLRLFRLCDWRRAKRKFALGSSNEQSTSSANQQQVATEEVNYGFYHRTRLDCTPVLIGSISLGLIQLIVIGLDIAYNVDWLSENHWPTSLPLLHFAFVSLLMQYVLGKVAKKQEQRKSGSLTDGPLAKTRGGEDVDELNKRAAALSISESSRRYNNREPLNTSEASTTSGSNNSGFENIALAHLLVTHILLWLMKLNSISLFQVIEQHHHHHYHQHHNNNHDRQQQQQHQQQQQQQQQHSIQRQQDQQSISNKLFPIHSQSDTQLPPPLSPFQHLPPAVVSGGGAHSSGDLLHQNHASDLTPSDRHTARPIGRVLREPSSSLEPALVRPIIDEPDKGPPIQSVAYPNPTIQQTNLSDRTRVPVEATEPPAVGLNAISDSTTTTTAITSTTSQPNVLDAHSNKAERGHRSAGPLDRSGSSLAANSKGSQAVYPNTRWAQHSSSAAKGTTATITPTTGSAASPATNSRKSTGHQIKSSLPKRMTAFRQRPSSSSVVATQVTPRTTTIAPPTSVSTSKQRARVIFHRVEDPVHLESPETEAARQRRAKQAQLNKTAADGLSKTPTTERPFPSVESDPPILTSTTPSSSHVTTLKSTTMKSSTGIRSPNSKSGSRNDYVTLASSPKATDKTLELAPNGGSAVESVRPSQIPEEVDDQLAKENHGPELATEEESGNENDIEVSDIDLDSLLPPVPDYNDTQLEPTNEIEIDLITKKPSLSPATSLENSPASTNDTQKTTKAKKVFDLNEDAFAFNEAASEVVNASIAPALPEPLVMGSPQKQHQQRQQQEGDRGQPTFADYLMPIVHQYHILIAAILFNMWLDGLRYVGSSNNTNQLAQAPPHTTHQDISFSNKRLISSRDMLLAAGSSCSSSSEVGADSVSRTSSTRGLVAIPIRNQRRIEHAPESRYISPLAGFAFGGDRLHKSSGHWRQLSDRHGRLHGHHRHNDHHHRHSHHLHNRAQHLRSRSMESLQLMTRADELGHTSSSSGSTLSRRHSVRSTSSQILLWAPNLHGAAGRARSPLLGRQVLAPFSLRNSNGAAAPALPAFDGRNRCRQQLLLAAMTANSIDSQAAANSVCSVFFGLIVVSITLIVILVGIDLLSVFTQCLTQLISIMVCLIGLLLIWRAHLRKTNNKRNLNKKEARICYRRRLLHHLTESQQQAQALNSAAAFTSGAAGRALATGNHRQCFHYLFLLAAYYCGISIALNLSKQHSMQQLFSQQVIQFIHRHLGSSKFLLHEPLVQRHHYASRVPPDFLVASIANYLFLFHLILIVKGLLLIIQVTLQTLLIRSSCRRVTKELRQIYTFLMFANISLWALEICEQQQHLQRYDSDLNEGSSQADSRYKLISLDSFTRFAASIVTLSHLYHGLVFMQQ